MSMLLSLGNVHPVGTGVLLILVAISAAGGLTAAMVAIRSVRARWHERPQPGRAARRRIRPL